MSQRWFRLYEEVLDDPKVQRLEGETFKVWVNLLCLACRNDGYLPSIADVAFALRMTEEDAQAVLERLHSGTLLDKLSGGADGYRYAPHAWQKRQYKSDGSTERVKRYRERNKGVTETAPEQRQSQNQNTPQPPRRGANRSQSDDLVETILARENPPKQDGMHQDEASAPVAQRPDLKDDTAAKITGEIMRRAKMIAPPVDLALLDGWLRGGIDQKLILDTVTRMAGGAKSPIRAFRYFDAEIRRQHEAKVAADEAEIAHFRRVARQSSPE